MKKVFIIVILVLLIICGLFMVKNKKYEYEIEKIDEYNYYIYKEDAKYGVIDKNGNIIVKANYSNIIIPNPKKDIFVCYNEEKSEILNSSNNKLFEKYDKAQPIKLKFIASDLIYEKNTLKYEENGLYGLIDFKGKSITKNIYDSIESLPMNEGKFIVCKDKKYGIVDLKGNTLVKEEYDTCVSDGFYTKEEAYKKSGFIVSNKTEDGYKYGYYNYKGKKILDVKFNKIERVNKKNENKNYLIASENGKYGVFVEKKQIIPNEYQEINYNEELDLFILQKNKKYGVADTSGKIIVDIDKDKIFQRGIYIYISKDENKSVVDKFGNIVDIDYKKNVYTTDNENFFITTLIDNSIVNYGIINKDGKELVKNEYRYLEYLFDDYFIAKNNEGNLGIIDINNKVILEFKYISLQKLKEKNIIQALDEDGNTLIYSAKFENTLTMKNANINKQEEYIIVSNENEKMYLDNNGNIINDNTSIKQANNPDKIGEYEKEQVSIEKIYYVKK